jgi:hypothetical protein
MGDWPLCDGGNGRRDLHQKGRNGNQEVGW